MENLIQQHRGSVGDIPWMNWCLSSCTTPTSEGTGKYDFLDTLVIAVVLPTVTWSLTTRTGIGRTVSSMEYGQKSRYTHSSNAKDCSYPRLWAATKPLIISAWYFRNLCLCISQRSCHPVSLVSHNSYWSVTNYFRVSKSTIVRGLWCHPPNTLCLVRAYSWYLWNHTEFLYL